MSCQMCSVKNPYKNLLIKQYKYWRVELACNQVYLGKIIIILNRHFEDFMDISKEERNELFQIGKEIRDALTKNFHPDKFNYPVLGNLDSHVHMHIIPRYETPRTIKGQVFTDANWGKNYSPYDKDFTIPDALMQHIKQTILSHITSL